MNKIFEYKVAIVTGGASGIGKSTAVAFARLGAKIAVVDVQDGSETVELVKQAGSEAIFIKCDVSKDAEVEAMVNQTVKTFGRLDFAINNAGVEGVLSPVHKLSESDWDKTININLKGIWLCMKHQIPYMLQQGSGSIVNTASIAGVMGFANMAAYVSSKHGVVGLTKTAALELAKSGIRVNAICPGAIKTPMAERGMGGNAEMEKAYLSMIPMGRMGKPEEIADTAVYLCSDAAGYVTGQIMVADGGWTTQ